MRRINWLRGAATFLLATTLFAVAAACLRDNEYQRWQLVAGTLYDNARWSHERSHFDPVPVDVAIFGSSRARLGLSGPQIEATLATLGRSARVANMAIIEDGRNVQWAIADQMFEGKRPKVLVLLVNEEPHRWGHPAFKYVAPAAAVAWPPAPLLHNSPYDIIYLPYRQMYLFAAGLTSDAFGLPKAFDPARYAASRIDDTVSHRQEDGRWIEMDVRLPRDVLIQQAATARSRERKSKIPYALTHLTEADEPAYVEAIVRLARAHGTRVVFVFIPQFAGSPVIANRAFYEQFGPIQDNGDLADRDMLYQGWAHLNHAGAMIVSDRVAHAIAPLL